MKSAPQSTQPLNDDCPPEIIALAKLLARQAAREIRAAQAAGAPGAPHAVTGPFHRKDDRP